MPASLVLGSVHLFVDHYDDMVHIVCIETYMEKFDEVCTRALRSVMSRIKFKGGVS